MPTLAHQATTMAPPGEKKPNFFKRHMPRKHSNATDAITQPPQSPRPQTDTITRTSADSQIKAPAQTQATPLTQAPAEAPEDMPSPLPSDLQEVSRQQTATSYASIDSSYVGLRKVTSNGTDGSAEQPAEARHGSNPGAIRFASQDNLPGPRQRRTSSAAATRRSSIYLRVQGGYVEGVDAGVGSKARRLSLAIPEEFKVDECPLGDHFSILSRAGKKDIGEGGAAVVRLMQSKTAGTGKDKLFAVKEFREWEPEEENEWEYGRKIKSEYAIAKSCQHPNVVETFRLCYSDKKWFHVMEYCELGDLNDLINKNYFSREDRNCMFKQLIRGVEYLHARGIAHRDLKSENLLLTKEGCLKIADFGTAEVFSGTHPGLKGCRRQSIIEEDAEIRLCAPGMVGSRPYMAPEIIKHEKAYDPRGVDVWSCAVIYLTLCVGGTPWEFASTDIKNYNIFCDTWDAWEERFPDGIVKAGRDLPSFVRTKQFQMLDDLGTKCFVMGMLNPDPSKRWSARDVLEFKTVQEYPCCQQAGYSDDIKTRQRKAMHNHTPPNPKKGARFQKQK